MSRITFVSKSISAFRSTLLLFAVMTPGTIFARDIYVAKNGNDTNAGTLLSPYKTIAKAASVATAGDNVQIREGTYEEILRPANSGSSGSPIIFQSYQNEKVVITAMQALNNWSYDSGSVYKTFVDWDLDQKNLVMNEDVVLDLARWPNNTDGDPYTLNALRNTGGSGANTASNARLDYASGIPNISWENGGSIFFYGEKNGWIAWKSFIKSSNNNRVTFDLNKNPDWIRTFHSPADGGLFYLEGVRGALDYQNEWYFDKSSNMLYVQLPGGGAPVNGKVKMRRRELTVDLHNRQHIELRNLAVFGGGINITGSAANNKIYGVSSFYGNHTRGIFSGFQSGNQSINLRGTNNTVEKSEIAFGAGNGIFVAGSNNKVLNSYVHDFNTLGSYDAVLMTRGGSNTLIKNNRLARGGRDIIQAFNGNSEYAYNDISYSNLIADDCALFYTVGGPSNTEIHHNWFHDAYARDGKFKAAGIYLDNDSSAFDVHHNVVWNTQWTNIQINWNGKDIDIFNNTLVDGSKVMGAWHKEGTAFSNVRVWNNLSNDNNWEPQSNKQNNLTYTSNPFVNKTAGDFRLKSASEPIDYGRTISGVTDGYKGSAPDAGAYELGATDWVAGVDWDIQQGPDGEGCYGLPGENCAPVTGGETIVPGTVEAENYNRFSDSTLGNSGNQYRSDDVDIQLTSDSGGGYNVGWIVANEWLEYAIDVTQAGDYKANVRVASVPGNGLFTLEVDGVQVGSAFEIDTTGGWQDWTTISKDIGNLSVGKHTLRIQVQSGNFNLNWLALEKLIDTDANTVSHANGTPTNISDSKTHSFELDYTANDSRDLYVVMFTENWQWLATAKEEVSAGNGIKTLSLGLQDKPVLGQKLQLKIENRPRGADWNAPGVISSSTTVTVINGNNGGAFKSHSIPGKIEAEDYDKGGSDVSYTDSSNGNDGGQYREDNVDIGQAFDTSGGYLVGWISSGEWLEYTVSNITSGTYDIKLRVAAAGNSKKQLSLQLDGSPIGNLSFDATGGWQSWSTQTISGVFLAGGSEQKLRLSMDSSSFNVNWLEFVTAASGTGDQCDTTSECKGLFGNQATDCLNSWSDTSICMCGPNQCQ